MGFNFTEYLRGGLYSPLATSWVSGGLTRGEAFEKFFRALVLASLNGASSGRLNSFNAGQYGSEARSWNSARLPIGRLSTYGSMRSGFWSEEGPRAPSENWRELLNLHLNRP